MRRALVNLLKITASHRLSHSQHDCIVLLLYDITEMEALGKLWRLMARRGNDDVKTIPIYLVFFFVINYTMGTGFLGVPFAFYHSGIITGLLTMLVVGFLSYVGAIWLLESMARAQVSTVIAVSYC